MCCIKTVQCHCTLWLLMDCVCVCVFVHFQKTMHSPPLSLSVRQQYTWSPSQSEEGGEPPLCFNVTVKTSRLHTCKHSSAEPVAWKNEGEEREGQRGQEWQRERERVLQSPNISDTIRSYCKPLSRKHSGNLISILSFSRLLRMFPRPSTFPIICVSSRDLGVCWQLLKEIAVTQV